MVADAYEGRVVCPYCGAGRGAPSPPTAPGAAKPKADRPRRRGRKRRRKPEPPTDTAAGRSARHAWERVPPRQRRRREWPPPRDPQSTSPGQARRRRAHARPRWLNPYLILLIALAIFLAVFALLASRHAGTGPQSQSARPGSSWETAFTG